MRFFTFFFVFLVISGFSSAEKLKIGIFIEAECRYSKQFISNQFRPAYNGIKDQVDVDFFTFGKSESFVNAEGKTEFTCQHGPEECRKNKIQTCGLNMIGTNKDLQAEFIECTMGFSKSYVQCADLVNLKYSDIVNCADGVLGTELQLQMENASSVIKESGHVPTITFDGNYNVKDFFQALDDFYGVVERKLAEKRP